MTKLKNRLRGAPIREVIVAPSGFNVNSGARGVIASGAAALGAAFAQALKQGKGNKAKKKKRKSSMGSAMNLRGKRVAASNFGSMNYAGRTGWRDSNVVPFDMTTMPIYNSTGAGAAAFGAPASGCFNIELDPGFVVNATGYYTFGVPIATLQNVYRRWRLRSFSAEFVSAAPSTSVTVLAMVYLDDGAISATVQPTGSSITGTQGAQVFNAGAGLVPFGGRFNGEWLWCKDQGTHTTPSDRQTSAGTIMLASMFSPGDSALNGFLHIKGVIEFADLSNAPTLYSASSPSPALPAGPASAPESLAGHQMARQQTQLHNCDDGSSLPEEPVFVSRPASQPPTPVQGTWLPPGTRYTGPQKSAF